jgi:hypothetical protein
MKEPDTYPRIAVSKNGDILITTGPAAPVLFVSRNSLPAFLASPQDAGAAEIRGVGAATIMACLAGGAQFETVAATPLTLHFALKSGLEVLFSEDDSVVEWVGRRMAHAGQVVVSPHQVVLIGPNANSTGSLVPLPAPVAGEKSCSQSSHTNAVAVTARQALKKLISTHTNNPRS